MGGPWDLLIILVEVLSSAAILLGTGGFCCAAGSGGLFEMSPEERPSRLSNLLGIGLIMLVLSGVSMVAHAAIRGQRARLAGTFAALLDRILTAARAARSAPTASPSQGPTPPSPGDAAPGAG